MLIWNTAANKRLNIFLRITHDICKVKLSFRYFSYIYIFCISYQMYELWSCVTFYYLLNGLLQSDGHCISTSWKWFNIEVYTRYTWFHFELNLYNVSEISWKSTLVKDLQKIFWQTRKTLNIFKNVPKKCKDFKTSHFSRFSPCKT